MSRHPPDASRLVAKVIFVRVARRYSHQSVNDIAGSTTQNTFVSSLLLELLENIHAHSNATGINERRDLL